MFFGPLNLYVSLFESLMDNICLAWGFLCITEISVLKAIMIFKWSKIAGMDDIFFGQMLAKGNFGFLVLSQVKYFRLRNKRSSTLILFWILFPGMRSY
jgi:hypothetical protein